MSKRIGIVIKLWNGEIIKGYLADSEVKISLDENSCIRVDQKIYRTNFIYDFRTEVLTLDPDTTWDYAESVAFNLANIGFSNLKLKYGEKLYKVIIPYKIVPIEEE